MIRRARLTLLDGSARDAAPPEHGAPHAIADGACPACEHAPFRVRGNGIRIAEDDRHWEADAVCVDCVRAVGVLRVRADTIFGLREDRACVEGRTRVYA